MLRAQAPVPDLDDTVDAKGQEGLGLVEDAEHREGHEGLLRIHRILLSHQCVDSKHHQRDLERHEVGEETEPGWAAWHAEGTPPSARPLQEDHRDITRNVDTWKDTRDTEKSRVEVLRAPSSRPRMCRTLSRKASSQPWDLMVLMVLRMKPVSRARESFCLICSSWDQAEGAREGQVEGSWSLARCALANPAGSASTPFSEPTCCLACPPPTWPRLRFSHTWLPHLCPPRGSLKAQEQRQGLRAHPEVPLGCG